MPPDLAAVALHSINWAETQFGRAQGPHPTNFFSAMLIGSNVGKRYGARVVLRRLNFDIAPGRVVAVVGRNGSGKSTLLRAVAALTNLDAGMIEWQDDNTKVFGEAMRLLCGLCAPDVPLYRELTCGENLQFWAQLRPASTCSEEELRARLEAWELGARWNDLAGDLSSGLRARLALCVRVCTRRRFYCWMNRAPIWTLRVACFCSARCMNSARAAWHF